MFTAFADTAFTCTSTWLAGPNQSLALKAALVTGAANQTTLPHLRRDLTSILTAFSPRSKERPEELTHEGELDLLIATDCISEARTFKTATGSSTTTFIGTRFASFNALVVLTALALRTVAFNW